MAYRLADCCDRCVGLGGLAAAIARSLSRASFCRPLRQGKNRLRETRLRPTPSQIASRIASRAAHRRAVRRGAGPARSRPTRSARRAASSPSSRQIIDGLKQARPTISRPRSRPAATTTPALVDIRLQLEDLARQLLKSGLAFRPRIAEINARIEQLGPPPAEGQPAEPDIVTQREAGAGRRKGRDQRRARRCRKPVAARQRPDRPHRASCAASCSPSLLTKRYDINYALVGEVVDDFYSEGTELSADGHVPGCTSSSSSSFAPS